jgi:hypothetical protein
LPGNGEFLLHESRVSVCKMKRVLEFNMIVAKYKFTQCHGCHRIVKLKIGNFYVAYILSQ